MKANVLIAYICKQMENVKKFPRQFKETGICCEHENIIKVLDKLTSVL